MDTGALATAEQYLPASDQWRTFPSLNLKRECPGAAALNKCIYAIGGKGLFCSEVYCTDTRKWTVIAPMSEKRRGPGAAGANSFCSQASLC